jgi:uncharacterized phage infection (PIP) family protein YhgE
MKKFVCLWLALIALMLLTCVLLSSCGETSAEQRGSQTLYVYNWGEYISDGSEGTLDVNAEFEAYCREELGLDVTVNVLYALVFILPISLLYVGLGLLFGSILTDKQVGGVCGALLTNLSAWLSGTWFDLELVGGTFKSIAYGLPFVHAVELERAVLAGNVSDIVPHLLWVLGYAVAVLALAVLLFLRQMKKQ